ncbi:MAG: glycosyltransferase family 4 protein [Aquabacterium sp.]|nr:glycosyltransferase family 4 protein [Aquabacterium sp.]
MDIRPLTAAPYSGVGRQALALYNTLCLRPATDVVPFTNAPLAHSHRTWACAPQSPAEIADLHRPRQRYQFERHFLPDALSALAIDVYVATGNMGLPIGLSDVRRQRTRWVLQLHGLFQFTQGDRLDSGGKAWLYRQIDRWSIRHAVDLADAIWVPSSYTAQALVDRFPQARQRVRLLPCAVPFDAWQALQQEVFTPPRYWLLMGGPVPRKNTAWFLRAWQQARETWPELIPPLVVVGHPRDVPSVPQHVRFVHGLSDAQLSSWYRRAERFWYPSLAEGFGLPVIEAAACGTPVASATGSSLDEVSPPGSLRFDPVDDIALTQLMHRAARQGRGAGEASEELQQWASRYDLPRYGAALDTLLQELA